jgi:hypothetical protein
MMEERELGALAECERVKFEAHSVGGERAAEPQFP